MIEFFYNYSFLTLRGKTEINFTSPISSPCPVGALTLRDKPNLTFLNSITSPPNYPLRASTLTKYRKAWLLMI